MSTNDNTTQQVKGVVDNRIKDTGNNQSDDSQMIAGTIDLKGDEAVLLATQPPYYHHQQGAPSHQQYTMYPTGVTYSLDPSQVPNNAGIDYSMLQTQQIYQYPVYFSSESYHQPHGYEDPYQTSTSAQHFQLPASGGTPAQYHIQTAQYSSGAIDTNQQPQNYIHPENPSQSFSKTNTTMFDNTAAKYTADWVSRTTLIPSEMKVPPDQPVDSHDPISITPNNWAEGPYVVPTTSAKPIQSSATDQQLPPLDQQLAQLDITSYPFVPSQTQQNAVGYAFNWQPGTSQQQPQHPPPQIQYRDQTARAYSASALPKPQNSTWADVIKKTNNNKGPQQQQSQNLGNLNDQRGGTQSAQPNIQPPIRYEKSFAGPKNSSNQTAGNSGANFIRNSNRSSGNRGSLTRPPQNRFGQRQSNPNFSAANSQRAPPLPSLLSQQKFQNFSRGGNFGSGQRHPGNYNNFGGFGLHPQMPEFNPGVPPPALPSQFRPPMPFPPMMPPPFPPPPFNMMNPQQQQQFFRAFISQVRPDAMMPPYGQFGQRFPNAGFPFGVPPPSFGQSNRPPNFNRGARRGGRGSRFSHPRRNQDNFKYTPERQTSNANSSKAEPLDTDLANSVNRGSDFDRDETKTPEPKGDTETTGSSPNEDKTKTEDAALTSAKSPEN